MTDEDAAEVVAEYEARLNNHIPGDIDPGLHQRYRAVIEAFGTHQEMA